MLVMMATSGVLLCGRALWGLVMPCVAARSVYISACLTRAFVFRRTTVQFLPGKCQTLCRNKNNDTAIHVIFPAEERHCPSTKLYCLATEAHRCEQLAQNCYAALNWTHNLLIASPTPYRYAIENDTVMGNAVIPAWFSGRTSVSGQRSFAVLRSTCSWQCDRWSLMWVCRPL